MLELDQLLGTVLDEVLHHILFAEPVTTGNRSIEVVFQAVIITSDPGGSPFGSHCVATHGIDLGDQGNIQRWVLLGNGDCSSKPCASCADDGDIGLDYVQFCLLEEWSYLVPDRE